MSEDISSGYDVIIMGGGPAGSTLGALLAKRTGLRIALFDKEVFPREHIGESFAHPLVPVLAETGVLPKVLASDCWVKKFGGVFNWDANDPKVTFFDHANVLEDGVYRWSMHVDRAEFDHILLDHAAELGVEVFQGTSVRELEPRPDGCVVTLKDGRTVRGRYFVDASGRRNSIAAKQKRQWLSGYRNIAIWQHFLHGEPTQSLPGDWNVFREENLSPIGCFAFPDGWCWYIPVRKLVDGERKLTHSIGIVTNPEVLKQPGKDFTDQATFLRTVHEVPLLKDLIGAVEPIADKMLTATNYSMINDRFADYDERWILVGDAAYFVDPLFSSGVAFSTTQAVAVAMLLERTLSGELSEQAERDLWRDYDEGWHGMAETFALSIDQWYHAIGKNNPDSIYWQSRGTGDDTVLDIQERTFDALLNTAFTPDLLQLMTQGTRLTADLDREGPFVRTAERAEPGVLEPDTPLTLAEGASVRLGVGMDVPGFKAFVPPPPFELPTELKQAIARYWEDPMGDGGALPGPLDAPVPCHRFFLAERPDVSEVRGLDRDGAAELWHLLSAGPVTVGQLDEKLTVPQRQLLKRLVRAQIVRVGEQSA
ncbi:tryptophan 7-halogenase [Allokutzneria sp. A3M-2-11 16]|uniref:NAD(P)/FAD-dependent oxidoreductase n=1 Tax=Allokutzneria sp. A3M-2-11 16 TaxID=2962043 RepID=UPI0020B71FC5|nr:NAD(P)/FAD-dependent oxidoreductase [Allokutzneria sp. A3M-2-11 16]MCP3804861.1 tryptophan 7-halogenase [Allokutzneria sp. A3M-2-11 16]